MNTSSAPDTGKTFGLLAGAIWLVVASAGFSTWSLLAMGTGAGFGLAVLVPFSAALLVAAIAGITTTRRPAARAAAHGTRRQLLKRYWAIVATEAAAIAVASVLCVWRRQFDLIAPVNIIIVGLHFLPLAVLFRVPRYHVMGIAFCLCGMGALVVFPSGSVIGAAPARFVAPSLACGLVAQLTAAAGILEAWNRIRSASASFSLT